MRNTEDNTKGTAQVSLAPEIFALCRGATTTVAPRTGWRFPHSVMPEHIFYAGADVLIFLGVVRDLIGNRRIHPGTCMRFLLSFLRRSS
jgi:hypothetical protein